MTPETVTLLMGALSLTGMGGFALALLKYPGERTAAIVGMQSSFIDEIQADREALRQRVSHLEDENRELHSRLLKLEQALRQAGISV